MLYLHNIWTLLSNFKGPIIIQKLYIIDPLNVHNKFEKEVIFEALSILPVVM